MSAIERARAALEGHSLCAVKGENLLTFDGQGINDLLKLFEDGSRPLDGASVADKIVGKAAAILMKGCGVCAVYAEVLSADGEKVLKESGIPYTYGTLTPFIENRAGTGQCPMEQTVRFTDDPAQAAAAMRRTQAVLRAQKNGGQMKKLGMGMMRLPVKGGQKDVDTEQVNKMIDTFLARGFEYFDTAYVYHERTSEIVVRECLVKRYPRECFKLATKLPTFELKTADDMPRIFEEQLQKCGVEYFDYYLLHNLNSRDIDAAEEFDAFGFARKLKEQGKVKNYGFSFHDTPEMLDELLTKHPDVDFVQLQINYLDWDSDSVQSRRCWEVARKHGKKVIVMEPVKGGALANVPEQAAGLFRAARPDMSVPSWAIRFAAGLDGVFMVLSGMSNMEQLEDNTSYMQDFKPLTDDELAVVDKVASIIKGTGAIACTACRYCVEGCPMDIPIPDYFSLYNMEILENRKGWTTQLHYYENYAEKHGKASDCVKCGACEAQCPQHLEIRDLLEKVAAKFE